MNISKRAQITDTFRCPKYPELNTPVSYKFCMNRQLTKLAGGGNQYLECVECVTGMAITKHFKDYKYMPAHKGQKPNWNTDIVMDSKNKKKRAKMGTSPYSPMYTGKDIESVHECEECQNLCHNCQTLSGLKTLVNAQVNLVIDLLLDNKLDNAMMRLGLVIETIDKSNP